MRRGRKPQAKVDIRASSHPSMREWRSSINTTTVLLSRTPISWPWVSLSSLLCTVLTRVLYCAVLNPKKKMAHFTKFWSSELVEEVESVVCKCVSIDNRLVFNITDGVMQFVERYNQRIDKEQPQATRVRKTAPSHKTGHQNIDDTDSSSSDDDDDCRHTTKTADAYIEEWNLYLNTHEVMPDDIEIVTWWGVCIVSRLVIPCKT